MMEDNYSNMGVGAVRFPDPTSSFTHPSPFEVGGSIDERGLYMGAAPFPNPTFPCFPFEVGGPINQRGLYMRAAAPFPNPTFPRSPFEVGESIDQRFTETVASFLNYPTSSFNPPFEVGGPIDQRGSYMGAAAPFLNPASTLYTLPNEFLVDPYLFEGFPFPDFVPPRRHYDDEAGVHNDLEKDAEVVSKKIFRRLYDAAINGNWKTAEGILRDKPSYARDSITKTKDTLLHIAAVGGNTLFVSKVVEKLSTKELEVQNEYG